MTRSLLFLTKTPELRPGSPNEQPYYVVTPESLARRWQWRLRVVSICHSIGLFWTAKNSSLRKRTFFWGGKISFQIKSILGNISIGDFSAFVYPIILFLYYADILKITKSRNWKRERSQVWIFYGYCKLCSFKCPLFIWIFCCSWHLQWS